MMNLILANKGCNHSSQLNPSNPIINEEVQRRNKFIIIKDCNNERQSLSFFNFNASKYTDWTKINTFIAYFTQMQRIYQFSQINFNYNFKSNFLAHFSKCYAAVTM